MTLEDPFFVVKDEVTKALTKVRGLYQRWTDLQSNSVTVGKEERDWTNTELRNAVRSIEWDLEDLEETISIVEKNPRKFRIDGRNLHLRSSFVNSTKEEVKAIKNKLNMNRTYDKDRTASQPLLETSFPGGPHTHPGPATAGGGGAKYIKLENELESPTRDFVSSGLQQQRLMTRAQDEQLDTISDSMGTLKTMSRQIGGELDEQAVMIDDVTHDVDNTQSKVDTTMKKVAKVLHMSNDRRQWTAIGVLSGIMVVVVILFFVL